MANKFNEKLEDILEDLGLFIGTFTLTKAHYAIAEKTFTLAELEKLLEIAHAEHEDSIAEARAMSLRVRAVKAASGAKTPALVRRHMLRALAQKGFLVHDKYNPGGNKALIAKWKRFKEKGKRMSKLNVKRAFSKKKRSRK